MTPESEPRGAVDQIGSVLFAGGALGLLALAFRRLRRHADT
jgi:hypothetical protein